MCTPTPNLLSTNWRQEAFAMIDAKQNLPADSNAPGPGVIIYLLPLGAGNTKDDSFHHWSTPLNSFWCCSGSITESFGKIMDSIYFQRKQKDSPAELFINQLTPSSLHWRAGGLDVNLTAQHFGPNNTATATIKIEPFDPPSNKAEEAVLKLRIPNWVVPQGSSVDLNGGEVVARNEELQPGTYLSIKRNFKSGDKLAVTFVARLTTEKINDWHPEFSNLQAVILGNYLLAALTDGDRSIQVDPAKIAEAVTDTSEVGLVSLATTDDRLLRAAGGGVSLISRERCFNRMDCTFRLVTASGSPVSEETSTDGADLLLESMAHPQHFVVTDPQDGISVQRCALKDAATWRLKGQVTTIGRDASLQLSAAEGLNLREQDNGNLQVIKSDANEPGLELSVVTAVGTYPEGAKLLKGDDKTFVIVPIGNIIEERYSPYIEFTGATVAS